MDFTVAEFLAFARSKPADEYYCVGTATQCALGQFGSATGREHLHRCWDPEKTLGLPGFNDALGFGDGAETTFGALVERLEAIVQETSAKPSIWLTPQTYVDAGVGEYVK